MASKVSPRCRYSLDFKLKVLSDYYRSGLTKYFIEQRDGLVHGSIYRWEKALILSAKDLSLSQNLLSQIETMRKAKEKKSQVTSSLSKEEELQAELLRLRKALEYSELRNEALSEVLKIGREEYGIDLLKKAGAKQ